MKRLFAAVSAFAMLWVVVLPAFADGHSASDDCDVSPRVLISNVSAENSKPLSAGNSGKRSGTLVLLSKRKGQLPAAEVNVPCRVTMVTPGPVVFTAQSTSLNEPQSNLAEAVCAAPVFGF